MSGYRIGMAVLAGGAFPTAILRCQTGRFKLVGSVPAALTKERGGLFQGRDSMTWETEEEAVRALLAIGVTRFQRADCSWHQGIVA